MRKTNHYNSIIKALQELKRDYPTLSIGQHLATFTEDYIDLWSISDKEMYFALEKYKAELDLNMVPEFDINRVYKEGCNLDSILEKEEGEEEDY